MSEFLLDKEKTRIPAKVVLDTEKRLVKLVVGKRWWYVRLDKKEPAIITGLTAESVYPCVWKPFSEWVDANKGVVTSFLDSKITEQQLLERLKKVKVKKPASRKPANPLEY